MIKRTESRRWVYYINFKIGNMQFFGVHQELKYKQPRRTKLWEGLERTLEEDGVESIGYMIYEEYINKYSR